MGKSIRGESSVWDDIINEPEPVKKKSQQETVSKDGTTPISPSSSKSQSPSKKSGSDVWDEVITANDQPPVTKPAATSAATPAAPNKTGAAPYVSDTNIQFDLNPGIKKTPTVSIAGIDVPLGNVPVPSNSDTYHKELQERINSKTYNQEDVDVIAKAMKVSPRAAGAYIQGKAGTGTLLHFDDIKKEKEGELDAAVKMANKDFGRDDSFQNVFQSPDVASSYLKEIQGLYAAKMKAEIEALPEADQAFAGGLIGPASITDVGRTKEDVGKVEEVNKTAADKIRSLITNDIIEKFTDRVDLTVNQRVKEIHKLVDPSGKKNIDAAIKERLSPVRFLVEAALGNDNTKEIDLLNADKAGIEFRLNNALKDKIDVNNAAINSIAENGDPVTGPTDEQKKEIQRLQVDNQRLSKEHVSDKQMYDKYPVLFKQKLISEINNFNAIRSGNVEGYEGGGYDSENIMDFLKSNGYDINDQRVQDAMSSNDFKDYSFFGNPGKEIVDVFKNTGKSLGDIVGLRDAADLLSEKKNDELFPTRVGEKDEFQLTEAAKIGQNIGSTTGQVIGQGLLQYATGGLGRMAGLSELAAANLGFWSSGAAVSFDQAYKDSYDFIDNAVGRTAYAGLIALSNAASEKIFPEVKLFKIPGVQSTIAELSKKIGNKEFTQEVADELLGKIKTSMTDYAKSYAKNFGKNVSQETVEEVSTDLFESGTRFIFGDPNISVDKAIESAKNTAIQTATGMLAIGAYGAHKDVRQELNTSSKATVYNAGLYHDEATDAINKGFQEGLYDNDERNAKIKTVNTAKSAIAVLDKTEKLTGAQLTRPQKELYVANLTAEALLTQQLDELGKTVEGTGMMADRLLQNDIQKKIDNLQSQRAQLLKDDVQIDADGNIIPSSKTNPNGKENNNGSGQEANAASQGGESNQSNTTGEAQQTGQADTNVTDTGAAQAAPASKKEKPSPGRLAAKAAEAEEPLTPEEQKVVDAFKGGTYKAGIKGWTDVLEDDNAPASKKRQVLKELSEQLSDPNSEVPTSTAIGRKAGDALYEYMDKQKAATSTEVKEPSGKGSVGVGGDVVNKVSENDIDGIIEKGVKNEDSDYQIAKELIGKSLGTQSRGISDYNQVDVGGKKVTVRVSDHEGNEPNFDDAAPSYLPKTDYQIDIILDNKKRDIGEDNWSSEDGKHYKIYLTTPDFKNDGNSKYFLEDVHDEFNRSLKEVKDHIAEQPLSKQESGEQPKSENKPIQSEQAKEADLISERDAKIISEAKPAIKIPKVDLGKLAKATEKQRMEYSKIKDTFNSLKEVLDCIWQ